ncbi:MAG: Mur ligase domain-containing protein, partial [Chloroflexota bacterium]|nr:Mur ligase domain-containing protein [Chloroflexota bacterium]
MNPTIAALPDLPAAVHFVGVGGIGMSGLARILHAWGYDVTGSDSAHSDQVDLLNKEGIPVSVGHTAVERATSADLVVATAAVRSGNPELDAAAEAGVPIVKRAELLGLLAKDRTCVAVAGSHGKSTTSGMLVSALRALGSDPTYAVGAIVGSTGTNAAPGTSGEMVVEADEYDYSFLWLKPNFSIVTNIDYDHPDLFPDQATYDGAFQDFVAGAPPGGLIAVNGDDPGVRRSLARFRTSPARLVTYGRSPGVDWHIDGRTVCSAAGETTELILQLPGDHNIGNAAAALIVLTGMGYP